MATHGPPTMQMFGWMLARFLTPKVAEAGLHHPEESVRQLSLGYLKELAEEGDPFAREILEK